MSTVWLGMPAADRTRRRMAFDGPVAVFEGATFAFLCEKSEAFRPGLSAYLDEYGYRVIEGTTLEEFGWLADLLRRTVEDYPDEWPVQGGLVARRDDVLRQVVVLSEVVGRAEYNVGVLALGSTSSGCVMPCNRDT